MPKTYSALRLQLEALEKQIELTRVKEAAAVIKRMRVAIQVYGITAEELYGEPKKPKTIAPSRKTASKKRIASKKIVKGGRGGKAGPRRVKYADDKGNRWSGGGSTPVWLRTYL